MSIEFDKWAAEYRTAVVREKAALDNRFADIHERSDRIEQYAADLARDKRISK